MDLSLPTGTAVRVLFVSGLSSASAKAGQRFQAYLNGDLMASGRLVAPKGARVSGRVVEATSGTGMGGAPVLTLELTDMEIGGQMYGLATSQVRLTMEGRSRRRKSSEEPCSAPASAGSSKAATERRSAPSSVGGPALPRQLPRQVIRWGRPRDRSSSFHSCER
jgi:hypothetical protein